MPNRIIPRRSFTVGSVPLPATDISAAGELLINWADKVAYTKDANGNLVTVTLGGSGGGSGSIVPYATEANFPATGASGTIYLATDAGRIFYWSGSVYVEAGTDGGGGSSSSSWTKVDVPASATATGSVGQYSFGGGYFYVATGANQWERSSLSTWVNFTPASISGLQLWLDASSADTLYDATSGGSLVAVDGAVARWEDKSGNGRHFTQATSGSRPLRKTSQQNGKDVLRFDGSNDYLDGGDYLDLTSTTALTIFAVVKRASTGSHDKIIGKYGFNQSTGLDYGWDFGFSTADKVSGGATNGGQYTVLQSNSAVSAASFALLGFKISGGSAKTSGVFYKNGSAIPSTYIYDPANGNVQDAGDTAFPVRLGVNEYNGSFSQQFDGDFAEVVAYNAALSDTDRAAIETYLMQKWGIA